MPKPPALKSFFCVLQAFGLLPRQGRVHRSCQRRVLTETTATDWRQKSFALRDCGPLRQCGSVDILVTTMRIRDTGSVEIVVCYVGRRCDGRSWTPAVCPHRPASFPGGAPALPKPIQQTPIHAAAVAGHSLSDALRGLDFSRSRGASWRASRIAPDVGTFQCTRLHDAVPFLAASRRPDHRSRRRRDGAPIAQHAEKKTGASPCGGRRDGLGARSGQHVLCPADASSRAKTAAVETLVEVGDRGGSGSTVRVVADRSTWPVERLREFAYSCRSGFQANAHRAGAGRRRIRQREKSHLYSTAAGSTERDPGQTWQEDLAHPRSPRRDATSVSTTALPAPISDRDLVQFSEAQTLGPRARPLAVHPEASTPVARIEFQSLSLEASLPFLEDVNRARWLLVARSRFHADGAIGVVARAPFDAVVDGNLGRRSQRFVVVRRHAERGSHFFIEAAHAEKLVGGRGKLPAVIGEEEFLIARVPQTRELAVHHDRWKNRHQVVIVRGPAKLRATSIFFYSSHTARAAHNESGTGQGFQQSRFKSIADIPHGTSEYGSPWTV